MSGSLVPFQPEPSCGRGTASILWSCLTTIFLCTWTVQHEAVPKPGKSLLKKKLVSFFGTLLVPEWSLTGAVSRFIRTWQHSRQIRRRKGWEAWTLKQSFLVGQDGIVKGGGSGRSSGSTPMLLAEMADIIEADQRQEGPDILSIELFPTNKQIDGRSKSDRLAKTIAIVQALWFATTVIHRLATPGLRVSLLEVLTAGYVFCGAISFLLFYECPHDLEDPFILDADIQAVAHQSGKSDAALDPRIPFTIAVALFTAIHVAAWNYEFPSVSEAWLWRVTTMLSSLLILLFNFVEAENKKLRQFITDLLFWSYVLIRAFIIVESFVVFRAAPAGIYVKADWTSYWGHIGN